MRVCRTCQADKPTGEFGKNSAYKDGLDTRCKACERARKARRFKTLHCAGFPGHPPHDYPGDPRRTGRPAKFCPRSGVSAESEAVARYQAAKRGAPSDGTDPTWQKVADRDGLWCRYCGVECIPGCEDYRMRPTLDHIVPVSKGGAHSMGNAALACWSCNSRKGNNDVTVLGVTSI